MTIAWKRESPAGNRAFSSTGHVGTTFGTWKEDMEALFPLPKSEVQLHFIDGNPAAAGYTRGADRLDFDVNRLYNHGYAWVMAMGEVSDEGGGIFKVTLGALPSFSIYSRYGNSNVQAIGCKCSEADIVMDAESAMLSSLSFTGMGIDPNPPVLSDEDFAKSPANIENYTGGWTYSEGDLTWCGENLMNVDHLSMKIVRNTMSVPTNNPRMARRVHDPMMAGVSLGIGGDWDGTHDELIEAVLDMNDEEDFTWKIPIDDDHWHQVNIEKLVLNEPAIMGTGATRPLKFAISGTVKGLEVLLKDGHDYTTL